MQLSHVMTKSVFYPALGKPGADAMGKDAFTEFMNSNSPQVKSVCVMMDEVLQHDNGPLQDMYCNMSSGNLGDENCNRIESRCIYD